MCGKQHREAKAKSGKAFKSRNDPSEAEADPLPTRSCACQIVIQRIQPHVLAEYAEVITMQKARQRMQPTTPTHAVRELHRTGGIASPQSLPVEGYGGNQAMLRRLSRTTPHLQCKLQVGAVNDPLEAEADRVADQVMRMPDPGTASTDAPQTLRRNCACEDSGSPFASCAAARQQKLQNKTAGPFAPLAAPPIVDQVLASPGHPLDPGTRAFFEPRFGTDFSRVRIHTGPQAAQSALAVDLFAYTVGHNIVFAERRYAPSTHGGGRLLAHELAHVVQQQGAVRRTVAANETISAPQLQRQDDPSAGQDPDGGAEFVPAPVTPPAPADAWICGRPLNYPVLNLAFNHAYVKAPPDNYAIVAPLCTPTDGGSDSLMFGGTAAHKWDNSCDPGASKPECIPCRPKRGVADVKQCLRDAYNAYNSPTMHKAFGPNSNTFAFTLANTCCANITTSSPFASGTYPGWGDPPAPTRPATCPSGPPDCS